VIDRASWTQASCFNWLQKTGNVEELEMLKTFNCGIGMILVVDTNEVDKTLSLFNSLGEQAQIIGEVEAQIGELEQVRYLNL
jgi:phosphoribosylformylglycinamidine cyclo-ligase